MFVSFCAPNSAHATDTIDTDAACSLTLSYTDGGTALPGVDFSLYKVADVSDTVAFALTDAFKGSGVDLSAIDSSSEWQEAALTFSAYAEAHDIAPAATGTTDEAGTVEFSDMSVGLYVVPGTTASIADVVYTSSATCVLLPTLATDDTWNYHPAITPKHEKQPVPSATDTIDVTVSKVWADDASELRPESIQVSLIRGGEIIDTVTLSAQDSWSHTWEDMPAADAEGTAYSYVVSEDEVPSGYSVLITEKDTASFTITNTLSGGGSADDNPEGTDNPGTPSTPDTSGGSPTSTTTSGTGTSGSGSTGSGNTGTSGTSAASSTLPQTGQTNWPVPVLCAVGFALICAGLFLKRKPYAK